MARAIWAGSCEQHPDALCIAAGDLHCTLTHASITAQPSNAEASSYASTWLNESACFLGAVQVTSRDPLVYVVVE